MKKYFMAGTDDELQFGDVVELTMTKEMKNGRTKHSHLEFEFEEPYVPLLLEEGVIEEREVEDEEENDDLIDFCDDDEVLNDLLEDYEALEQRVEVLEEQMKKLLNPTKKNGKKVEVK